MTKVFKVEVKRSICDRSGTNYNHSIWSDNKIIDLNLKSDQVHDFTIGDFIILDDEKRLLKVIKKNRGKTKSNSVKLKK
jgi:hypothetical protein